MGTYHYIVNYDRHEFLKPHDFGGGAKYGELCDTRVEGNPSCAEGLLYLLSNPDFLDDPWKGWWHNQRVAVIDDHGCLGGFTEALEDDDDLYTEGESYYHTTVESELAAGRRPWRCISKELVKHMRPGRACESGWWGRETDEPGCLRPADYDEWEFTGSGADWNIEWRRKDKSAP